MARHERGLIPGVVRVIQVTRMPDPLSVRFDAETLARLDRVAEALSKRSAGLDVGRSRVIKLAVQRALPGLESELGLAPKRPKPKPKK